MNKKIYLLLPLCVTFLPACSSSHTLTLINSDSEAGTIITEGGKFKTGEIIKIQTELVQGYKVDKWVDSTSGKIGSRAEFNFTMPNRDAELTVYYEYDDFKINCNQVMNAEEGYYDFNDEIKSQIGSFGVFTINDDHSCYTDGTYEATWKDTVNIDYKYTYSSSWYSFKQISDEEGNKLGDTSYSFEMPNHDTSLTFEYASRSCVAKVSTNFPNASWHVSGSGFVNLWSTWVNNVRYFIFLHGLESYSLEFELSDENYVFDHWINLSTNEILSYDTVLNVTDYSGVDYYQAVLHEA